MALTQAQQDRITALTAAKDRATADYNAAVQNYNNKHNAAESCQAARDQYSLGPKKNQACHIDTLASLHAEEQAAERDRNTKQSIMQNAEKALADALKEIDAANQLGAAALQTDASFVLQSQAQQQQAAAQNADNERKLVAQKSTWYIVAGIIVVVVVIGGIIVYKKYFKK
jgi:hypothetical protein